MSADNTGGPAFPYSVHMEGFDRLSCAGMTLRDYFAGQVLVGLATRKPLYPTDAPYCYELADAMLAARSPIGETVE